MTKNQKISIACVSILFILIAAILLIRSPSLEPDPISVATPTPAPLPSPAITSQPNSPSESHEKVAEIIDYTSSTIAAEIPGLWVKVQDSWQWLMEFDTKHALILVVVLLFICSIIIGGKNKKSS